MTNSAIITDEGSLREVVAEILRRDAFFYDVESVGEHRGVPHLADVTWCGLGTDGLAVAVPFGHPIGDAVIGQHSEPRIMSNGKITNNFVLDYEPAPRQIRRDIFFEICEPLFFSERLIAVAHGQTYDGACVPKYYDGRMMTARMEDNITLDWLLNENRRRYGAKWRTREQWGVFYDDEEVGRCVEKHPFSKVAKYLYLDIKYPWLQWRRNRPQIEKQGLEQVWELECKITRIVTEMRLRGVRVDMELLAQMRGELAGDLALTEGELFAAAGRKFNINSTPQKATLLFGPKSEGGRGLNGWKLTDAGRKKRDAGKTLLPTDYSTDAEALADFDRDPVVHHLLDYQDTSKLLGTYVNSWLGTTPEFPWEQGKTAMIFDGRIHTEFVQYGTKTGRFSGREPNLQNIPARTERGKKMRYVFVADEGSVFVSADYSQIEPRLMAHFVGEGLLFDGFWAGVDPYIINAAAALQIDQAELLAKYLAGDKEAAAIRQTYGKTMFLAMGYGAGYRKLAVTFGVTEARSKQILANHEDEMPEIYAYKSALIKACKRIKPEPFVSTILGRRRRMPELNWSDNWLRSKAERQLFNSQIQGSAADLMKMAMERTHDNLSTIPGAYIALTVHDELLCCGPEKYSAEMAEALKDGMIGDPIQRLIGVPLKADVTIGKSWGEAH